MIAGVTLKELVTHTDERGFLREIIRVADDFFQDGFGHLFYITSHTYDPADEERIPHDDPEIGYDWTAMPAIK
jgi:dTDP-4-dehydrorhamnose 3,5-epimerase-like enzyme